METALQFMTRLHQNCHFWNQEEKKRASNSFLRRLLEQKAIWFNGESMDPMELVDFPIFSLVMYPRSDKKRSTLV